MNVDKAKKRIAKKVKNGFKGYPLVTITYFGQDKDLATEVSISYLEAEGEQVQVQNFKCENEIRDDETIQSVLLKVIERSNAASVVEEDGITLL
ncbi:hypothetical protein [Vibrio rumoiensis]|uniref:Uncharacterized protein n=1 Tax=Vibrio rumoiensis 1S-45 TaxID=1188252 RepID=A0A1E5E5J5_9VIBR|nr:hypothetical protein [Vibrio rumoiensis]OEF29181.1 hypothetical protein A1QC_04460 [Vibrio rumoiensis 1S-45]